MVLNELRSDDKIWGIFVREEEYRPSGLDMYGRCPYYLSQNRSILEPSVSEFLIKNGAKYEYPGGKKFAVCLTHDIDYVNIPGQKKRHKVLDYLKGASGVKKRMFDNFRDIISLEEGYGAKSSFYFLALEKGEEDYNYDIRELENELCHISDKGWEVGLHGGHNAYDSLKNIKVQKKRIEKVLGKKVIGYRNHYLRFKVPDTWELLKDAGFKYDTTFGYADMIGFRNGMCHPFKPFNLNTNQEIDILEIPLIVMDGTLFQYMKLDNKTAWDYIKLLIDKTERYNGVLTILWHNNNMFGEHLKLYEKILDYCRRQGAWMACGEDVWRHWTEVTK